MAQLTFNNCSADYATIVIAPMEPRLVVLEYVGRNQVITRDHGRAPRVVQGTITLMATSETGLQTERQKWYAMEGTTGTLWVSRQGTLSNTRLMRFLPQTPPKYSPCSTDARTWSQECSIAFQQETLT